MKEPQEYSKRILLAVSGMSPQIVTETLYSLAVNHAQPFIPTEIHLITTTTGAKEARLQLLHSKTGKFHQLRHDYQLPPIQFLEKNIHIIEDNAGCQLDDIKTVEQNEAAADFITNIVNRLTSDEESALHVSIAGGRKTMGYYLGYALSLFGRHQDRLSHVLVTDRFESLKDFFYPTPESHVIEDRGGFSLDAKEAEVMMAEIPFVRLRTGIPEHFLEGKASFSESIKFVRQIEIGSHLEVDLKNLRFSVQDIIIKPREVDFVFYIWLLNRSMNNSPIIRSPDENVEYKEEYINLYDSLLNQMKNNDRTKYALKNGMPSLWISDRITGIKKSFEQALGVYNARPFIIQKIGRNNQLKYYIALSEDEIIYA